MAAHAATLERSIRLTVSKDQVRAYLLAGDANPETVTRELIETKLKEMGIAVSPEVAERIDKAVAAAKAGELTPEPLLLVEGRDPKPGVGAVFSYLEKEDGENTPTPENETVDLYQSRILLVAEGETIGQLAPEVPAEYGMDVFGKPVPGDQPLQSMQLGENVKLADDGRAVIATTTGKVHLTREYVSVVPVVEVPGDVDFETGNIEAPIDVLVNGTIREGFQVDSKKSITVRGAIEAAKIKAGTELKVNGGIVSRSEYLVSAGGEVFTKFCNDAHIQAGGDLTITRESLGSRLYVNGCLHIPRGALIGGRAYARQGAEIKEIGNAANVKTEVAIGVDPEVYVDTRRIDELIKKKRDAAAKIREKVQPLMAMLKRLTPQQREKATELMYEADNLDAEVENLEKQKTQMLIDKSPPPGQEVALEVHSIIFPGVKVVIGDRATQFHKERRGHFRISRRVLKRVEEIVLVDMASGSVTPLPSFEYIPESDTPAETRK
ncbi:MAG: DUF342 domain-containing protein [Phycisphaerales bacterium]|nr:DUF342 domain-containing protein [Phycisphaerales bacterium]